MRNLYSPRVSACSSFVYNPLVARSVIFFWARVTFRFRVMPYAIVRPKTIVPPTIIQSGTVDAFCNGRALSKKRLWYYEYGQKQQRAKR